MTATFGEHISSETLSKVLDVFIRSGFSEEAAKQAISEIHDAGILFREKKEDDSNLIKHALRELTIIGEEPQTIDMYLNVVRAFVSFGHSGGSASIAIPVINDLLSYRPLSPLTDDPDEWFHHDEEIWGQPGGIWQNVRDSRAFSEDQGKTYRLVDDVGTIHESDKKPG